MTVSLGGQGRFVVEIRDHAAAIVRTIPYANMQCETFLNSQGGNLRFDLPFRGTELTPSQLQAGKHEIWVWDTLRVTTFPIFAGPVTQITVGSRGPLAVTCADPLWYFSRRLLLTDKVYTGLPEAGMADLLAFTNGRRATGISAVTDTASATNISAVFKSNDFSQIDDLLSQLSDMGDGVDYYVRRDGASFASQLHLFGGRKKPTRKTIGMTYPGELTSYTYQQIATGLANVIFIVGSGSGYANYGSATGAAQIAAYNAQYEKSESANQNSNTTLNKQAATRLKATADIIRTPTIVLKTPSWEPWSDFDLGDRFLINVQDEWVQYTNNIRVVGWQASFSNDEITTVLYTNTEAEIT
jgi:hypothetical protein